MQATLQFHSAADKKWFLNEKQVFEAEIVSQTEFSITLDAATSTCVNWKNNAHVFSVSWN